MEDNVFEKFKSMINNGNIPSDLQNIISNMNSSSKTSDSSSNNSGISPDTISNLMNMLNSNRQEASPAPTDNSHDEKAQNESEKSNFNIDFETIMKFKTIMDKMNTKDDPRSKLLISLKPYLKESRKNKIDQYVQFLNMSKVIDVFGKSNGDSKSWV